jgi:hemolysin activation/secretion protein
MKLNIFPTRISKLIPRIVAFFPAMLTLPALAESFALPTCPYPEVLQNEELLLLGCDSVNPPGPIDSGAANPPPIDPLAPNSPKTSLGGSPNPLPPATTITNIGNAPIFGNTVLSPADITELLAPGKNRPADPVEMCKIANSIAKVYQSRGYILAQVLPLIDRKTALLSKNNRTLGFLVLEGCIENINITGTQRLKPSYINNRIIEGAKTPFNANKVNDFLALIQTDPKIAKLEVQGISPGKSFGSSSLSLKITESNSLTGFVGADAYVAPIFGGARAIGGLTYRNVTGNGDDLSASYFRSTTGEAQGADFSYQLPINAMNGQIQIRYAPNIASVILQPNNQPFKSSVSTAEINYRQPLMRTSSKEFAISAGFSFQDQLVSLNGLSNAGILAGTDSEGKTKTRVAQFSQEYTSLDGAGNWSLRSQFSLGLGAFGATINPRPAPDGKFFTWQGQVQRVQRFSLNNYAIAQFGVQLTPDPLLPNQKFTLGGDRSVRGYRQNVRSADNGIRLSLEDRFVVGRNNLGQANLQLVANVDAAKLWDNGGSTLENGFLASAGAGIIWEPLPKLVTRLDYAFPLVKIGDRGNSFQDSGFNFSIGYGF